VVGFTPCHYTPEETIPRTHCIGCWVGLTGGVYVTEKRKHILLLQGLETRLLCRPARSLVAIPMVILIHVQVYISLKGRDDKK
jgi:hypothetical protein